MTSVIMLNNNNKNNNKNNNNDINNNKSKDHCVVSMTENLEDIGVKLVL